MSILASQTHKFHFISIHHPPLLLLATAAVLVDMLFAWGVVKLADLLMNRVAERLFKRSRNAAPPPPTHAY